MPDIFKATSRVLEDLENLSRKNDADCSLDIRPELSTEVEQLALIGATELDCMFLPSPFDDPLANFADNTARYRCPGAANP